MLEMRYRVTPRWVGTVVSLGLVVSAVAQDSRPAVACACGLVIPRAGVVTVSSEKALIRFRGEVQDLLISMDVQSAVREASWIIPLPAPPQVRVGDGRTFRFLEDLTDPKLEGPEEPDFLREIRRVFANLNAAVGPLTEPPPVVVIERRTVGVYDLSTLQARTVADLVSWLEENGYRLPPASSPVLGEYVERGWIFAAVKIGSSDATVLSGHLPPLWMTFPSARPVYPVRLTALAAGPVDLLVWVLADHQVQAEPPAFQLDYANWIDGNRISGTNAQAMKSVADGRYFLTRLSTRLDARRVREDFSQDLAFVTAPTDEPFHRVSYEPHYVPTFFWLAKTVGTLMGIVLALALLVVGFRRWISRRTDRSPGPS